MHIPTLATLDLQQNQLEDGEVLAEVLSARRHREVVSARLRIIGNATHTHAHNSIRENAVAPRAVPERQRVRSKNPVLPAPNGRGVQAVDLFGRAARFRRRAAAMQRLARRAA